MKIVKLDWDSDFFGIKVGKLTLEKDNEFDPSSFKKSAQDKKFDLIYIFCFNRMLQKETIIHADLELVDVILKLSQPFDREKYKNLNYQLRTTLSIKELNECYSIAMSTSIVSRFYTEQGIGPQKTKELYKKWIDNTLNNSFSDGLFLSSEDNIVNGIHLIKTDEINKIGFFTLTGVDPNYKRKGIGKRLWNESFAYWANEKDVNLIVSPFSLKNKESFNFHLKMGFNKVEEIKYIYHYRNKT